MSLPDSALGPKIGPQHPMALSSSHFAMVCQALSLHALFRQYSTYGKLPSTVCKEWVTFPHTGISFLRIGSLVLARPDMDVNPFIGKCIASHGQGQFSPAFGKGPQNLWPRAEDSVAGDIRRGAGVRAEDTFLLSLPSGVPSSARWL